MIHSLPVLVATLALTASAARAGEPCRRAITIRDGKPFDPKVAKAPGFDPQTAPTVPWCDGDGLPTSEVVRLLEIEDREPKLRSAVQVAEERLKAEQAERAADKLEADKNLRACHETRLACERDKVPAPEPRPSPKRIYEKTTFWVGAGLIVASVITGVATKSDHPALYTAGGAGLGIMVAGEF